MTKKINDKVLSIDYDDDDENYKGFFEYIVDDTHRKQKKIAKEVDSMGDFFLEEIEKKNKKRGDKKMVYVKYIVRHDDAYDINELMSYSIHDVIEIYNETKENRHSFFKKIFKFLFNV